MKKGDNRRFPYQTDEILTRVGRFLDNPGEGPELGLEPGNAYDMELYGENDSRLLQYNDIFVLNLFYEHPWEDTVELENFFYGLFEGDYGLAYYSFRPNGPNKPITTFNGLIPVRREGTSNLDTDLPDIISPGIFRRQRDEITGVNKAEITDLRLLAAICDLEFAWNQCDWNTIFDCDVEVSEFLLQLNPECNFVYDSFRLFAEMDLASYKKIPEKEVKYGTQHWLNVPFVVGERPIDEDVYD